MTPHKVIWIRRALVLIFSDIGPINSDPINVKNFDDPMLNILVVEAFLVTP